MYLFLFICQFRKGKQFSNFLFASKLAFGLSFNKMESESLPVEAKLFFRVDQIAKRRQ